MLWHWRWRSQPTWLSAFGTITISITITIAIATTQHHHQHHHHHHHHRRTECVHIRTKLTGYWLRISLRKLSRRSNCLPFLQYQRLQISTPWPWGIVRSYCGGRAKDKVQTILSTDVMISANIHRLPPATRHTPNAIRLPPPYAKHCPPYATSLTPPGAWHLPLSKPLHRACRSIHGSI